MTKPNLSIKERFLKYVEKGRDGECWVWVGARQGAGRYGTFGIGGKMFLSHRVSYSLHKGEIPGKLNVLHTCDVPYCVNPEHLFLGDHLDNMRDKEEKGRGNQCVGQAHGNAKLTEAQVLEIRASTESLKATAKRYGVSFGLIGHIRARRAWNHI